MSLPKTLVMIETDPRTSPRPAEAIRIAAGIGAWKKNGRDASPARAGGGL